MRENDNEHQAFEKYGKEEGLDLSMHPLHLLYLNKDTAKELKAFKAGYKAQAPVVAELESLVENIHQVMDSMDEANAKDMDFALSALSVEPNQNLTKENIKRWLLLAHKKGYESSLNALIYTAESTLKESKK